MKSRILCAAVAALCCSASGQGPIVFDQESSADETPYPYGSFGAMQDAVSPWGQSFTPTLSEVGFIRLSFTDGNLNDGLGAAVYVNLRSGSISGPIIGATSVVDMPSIFRGVSQFDFGSPVGVTPGTSYFFEPVLQSGGRWDLAGWSYNYPGGSAYSGGQPVPQSDLWFREGIVVPEPRASAFALLAVCILLMRARPKTRESRP